jgi:hypothetical protein
MANFTVFAVPRIDDSGTAAFPLKFASIAGLAAAHRIKDRAIENHRTVSASGNVAFTFPEVGVFSE